MGAPATGGVRVLNDNAVRILAILPEAAEAVVRTEQRELDRRERVYRDCRPPPEVQGRTLILVDDGLATGSTMLAAIRALQTQHPLRIVAAVPTAAAETCEGLRAEADEVVCATTPQHFRAVGRWYENFEQTTDEEVCALLARARLEAVNEGPLTSELASCRDVAARDAFGRRRSCCRGPAKER